MKKKILSAIIAGFFCLCFGNNVFAWDWNYTWESEIDGFFYFTKGQTEEIADTFGLSDIPWLHLSIPSSYFSGQTPTSFEIQLLFHEDSSMPAYTAYGYSGTEGFGSWVEGSYQLSCSLSDWNWNSNLIGDWHLDWAAYGAVPATAGATLHATPEPISCLLFLVGAGPLAFFRFRRKKTAKA